MSDGIARADVTRHGTSGSIATAGEDRDGRTDATDPARILVETTSVAVCVASDAIAKVCVLPRGTSVSVATANEGRRGRSDAVDRAGFLVARTSVAVRVASDAIERPSLPAATAIDDGGATHAGIARRGVVLR
jgi:hypothetical protein